MSLLTRVVSLYDKVRHLTGESLEPDEILAFALGYEAGEKGEELTGTEDGWYKQGHKHGKLGD